MKTVANKKKNTLPLAKTKVRTKQSGTVSSLLRQQRSLSPDSNNSTENQSTEKIKEPTKLQRFNDKQAEPTEKIDEVKQTRTLQKIDKTVNDKPQQNTQVKVQSLKQEKPVEKVVAEVKGLDFKGTSDQSTLAFIDASPSSMAVSQPIFATSLNKKLSSETKKEAESAPVLQAKASGQKDLALVSTKEIKKEGAFQPEDNNKVEKGTPLIAENHQNISAAPDNTAISNDLAKKPDSGFSGWFRNNFFQFLDVIKTKDVGLNTSAGERHKVELSEDANLDRTTNVRSESNTTLNQQLDNSSEAFSTHPGQANIQVKEVNEGKQISLKKEPNTEITQDIDTGMAEYAAIALPENVRAKSDELLQAPITANLTDARNQTTDTAVAKETEKKKEIGLATEKSHNLNQEADQEQKDIIVKNRSIVADQQKKGVNDAIDSVKKFNKDAGSKQTTLNTDVKSKVQESESNAEKKLEQGEQDAEKKRKEEEQKAATKKNQLEKEQENDSWWDRVSNVIKSAVKVLSDAIDTIFTALRESVKFIIEKAKNAAIGLINIARDWVVNKLNDFRDWAKDQVNTYLKDLFPALAKKINDTIDAVVNVAVKGVNAVANTLIEGIEFLADTLAAVLDKILAVFQVALKAAVQIVGAVLTGDFAEALRIAIRAACEIAGIDPQVIFDFIDRAGKTVSKILSDPGTFFMNLVDGVGGGINSFADNIQTHLINGLLGWLTGTMSDAGITLPEKLDFKGVIDLTLQILNLTYESIKARVIEKVPQAEKVFNGVEEGVKIIIKIREEGLVAIWQMIKQSASDLKDAAISSIQGYIEKTVVKQGITWLLSLLNPVSAILKVVKLIFDFVMFLVKRIEQIKDFVFSVYKAITAIANGNLSIVITAVENALAKSLPVVISLLARLAGLGGIAKEIQNIIIKIRKPIDKVVNTIIDKMVSVANRLLGKDSGVDEKKKQAADEAVPENEAVTSKENIKDQEPINIADLNKPPVTKKRSAVEKKAHKSRVMKLLGLLSKKAKTTDDMEMYFDKIKTRYQLDVIKYDENKSGKLAILIKSSPSEFFIDFNKNMLIKANDGDETIKVNQINNKSIKSYKLKDVNSNNISFNAAQVMTAKYLAFDHPEGSATSSTELKAAFDHLPSDPNLLGNSRYIRGHLLNANIGGSAEDNNLFPITLQANKDHETKIENEAKDLVNNKNLLVYYKVEVQYVDHGVIDHVPFVNADFICELGTYHADKANKEGISVSGNTKTVVVKSRYTPLTSANDLLEHRKQTKTEIIGGIDTDNGIRREDFDVSKVKWITGLNTVYLFDITKQELLDLPGIGLVSANKILNKDPPVKTVNQFGLLIGSNKANSLKDTLNQQGKKLRFTKNNSS